jgi:hypothetical protein
VRRLSHRILPAFGSRDILLLASHQAAQVAAYVEAKRQDLPAAPGWH